jgi:hypothetical protein
MPVSLPTHYTANVDSSGKMRNHQLAQQSFDAFVQILNASEEQTNQDEPDKNLERRDLNRSTAQKKADTNLLDRKLLNQTEQRGGELESEYEKHLEHKAFNNEQRPNKAKIESIGEGKSKIEQAYGASGTIPYSFSRNLSREKNPLSATGGSSNAPSTVQSSAAPASTVATNNIQANLPNQNISASVALPNAPAAGIPVVDDTTATVAAVAKTAAFLNRDITIFSATGHLKKDEETDKKKDQEDREDEEQAKRKNKKKKQPFEALTILLPEPVRLTQTQYAAPTERQSHQQKQQPQQTLQPIISDSVRLAQDAVSTEQQTPQTQQQPVTDSPASPETLLEESGTSQEHFVHRVAAACEAAIYQQSPIRMKINLEHLGTLSLRMNPKGNALSLRFEAGSSESATFIGENLDELKLLLRKRNVLLETLEIVHLKQ